MSAKLKKICLMFVAIVGLLGMTACGETKEDISLRTAGNEFAGHYGDFEFQKDVYVDYEMVSSYIDVLGAKWSMGPSDPAFRGVIYISPEDAQYLLDNYTWVEEPDPELNCVQVDMSGLAGSTWMRCGDFSRELFSKILMNHCYFNGVDAIYFDIHET